MARRRHIADGDKRFVIDDGAQGLRVAENGVCRVVQLNGEVFIHLGDSFALDHSRRFAAGLGDLVRGIYEFRKMTACLWLNGCVLVDTR